MTKNLLLLAGWWCAAVAFHYLRDVYYPLTSEDATIAQDQLHAAYRVCCALAVGTTLYTLYACLPRRRIK